MGKVSEELKLYNKTVIDHFMNPRNVGTIENPTITVTAKNPYCGDMIKLSLIIQDDVIKKAMIKIFGCTIAIASASVLSEKLHGLTLNQASFITNEDIIKWLGGIPEKKTKCTIAAQNAVRSALQILNKKKEGEF